MYQDVIELAEEHAGYRYKEFLEEFIGSEGVNLHTEYKDGELRAFLCYVPTDIHYDILCVTDRYNKFTNNTWRLLIKYLTTRQKEIRINSTLADNPRMQKTVAKYGGYTAKDTLIFTKD